eukprot:4713705-Pyramimonas_sp.AAC.2
MRIYPRVPCPIGKHRSGVDALEPQKPTKSEEYQKRLQGVLYSTRVTRTSETRVTKRCEHPGFQE